MLPPPGPHQLLHRLPPAAAALPTPALPVPALPVPALPAWQIAYGSQPPPPDPYAAEPWQRPVDWLPLPAIQPGEQKLVGLVAIDPGEGNVLAVRAAGNSTVHWGDGTVELVLTTPRASGACSYVYGSWSWGETVIATAKGWTVLY